MAGQQPPVRCLSSHRSLALISLSVAGLALFFLALRGHSPGRAPLITATPPARTSASARGGRLVARAWVDSAEPVPALAPATAAPTTEAPATATPHEPATATPTREQGRSELLVYKVQAGDNLSLIAERLGISQDTVVWANPPLEKDPDLLQIGQELNILPVDGLLHTVRAGETLSAIAARYQVTVERIAGYAPNGIDDPAALSIGRELIIPGGIKPPEPRPTAPPAKAAPAQAAPAPAASAPPANAVAVDKLFIPAGAPAMPVAAPAQPGRFAWPTNGLITQGYGKWHGAIDIANNLGTPVLAADAGTVSFAGVSGGLGYAVQIAHGDGFATVYAHLDSIAVGVGQEVKRGGRIGAMGSTGNSTGPHLHFILTWQDGILDPNLYLPR